MPQSVALAQALLEKRLKVHNYYQCPLTPGLWIYTWRPIIFCLLIYDFGVDYVGEQHALHHKQALAEHYELTENWKGDLYSGINLEWNYDPIHSKQTIRLTMDDYIANLRVKYYHPEPRKLQHSPYKNAPIIYGSKVKYAAKVDDSPTLYSDDILRMQSIVSTLLFYGWSVNNKLLVDLSELRQQQTVATQATNDAIMQILDYISTYPSNGITFRARNMILAAHSDAAYLNFTKAYSRDGPPIRLSEDFAVKTHNPRYVRFVTCVERPR